MRWRRAGTIAAAFGAVTTLAWGPHATPMTYMMHGRQYVVIAAGGSGMLGSKQNDTVVAFALPAATGKPGQHAKSLTPGSEQSAPLDSRR